MLCLLNIFLTLRLVADYLFMKVTDYAEHEMHTPMNELSVDAAIYEEPIRSIDRDGWRELNILEALGPDASTLDFDISRTINSQPEWQDVQGNID